MFLSNQAVDVEALRQMNETFALRTWNALWEEEAAKGDDEGLKLEEYKYGQGGGIFIVLDKSTDKAAVAIYLEQTTIDRNLASVGGACIHNKQFLVEKTWYRRRLSWKSIWKPLS